MGTPGLARVAGDFVASVALFDSSPEEQRPEAAVLRSRWLGLLDAALRHPAAQEVPAEELEHARFALVAWADEVALRSDWPGRDEWSHDPLQLQLFRTNRGGDEFFERLARVRPDQSDAREVFLLCLALGFEGQYAGREPERRQLMQQQLEMLRAAGRATDLASLSPLAPGAYELEIRLGRRGGADWRRIVLAWGGGALALLFVCWVALTCAAADFPEPGA